MVRDDFEAALRARWDREVLAVYGDHLLSVGDPRGEMIAIDLRIAEAGVTPELAARRAELIRAWLGDVIPPGTLRYGFFEVDATSAQPSPQLDAAFRGPAAEFVRSVALCGDPETIARALAEIAAVPRPWLQRLSIRQWYDTDLVSVGDVVVAQLVAATPHLDDLEVDGRRVVRELLHPSVRRMRISGHDAVGSLLGSGAPLPGLVELDYAFHSHLSSDKRSPSPKSLPTLLTKARAPALRHLDLSRNEPGMTDPDSLGGTLRVAAFVRQIEVRDQLVTLRLPSMCLQGEATDLRAALTGMPALRELEVVRTRPGLGAGEPAPANPSRSSWSRDSQRPRSDGPLVDQAVVEHADDVALGRVALAQPVVHRVPLRTVSSRP